MPVIFQDTGSYSDFNISTIVIGADTYQLEDWTSDNTLIEGSRTDGAGSIKDRIGATGDLKGSFTIQLDSNQHIPYPGEYFAIPNRYACTGSVSVTSGSIQGVSLPRGINQFAKASVTWAKKLH